MAGDEEMMWEEVADIGALLHRLDDSAFDAPSLCEGWAVRDVLGHMASGHTKSMGSMFALTAKHGFNVSKASLVESKKFFAGASAGDIRRFWDEVMVAKHPKNGIAKVIPAKAGMLDHLVHNQDIRRPTGITRTIPPERLTRAIELARIEGGPIFNPKKNLAGLKLHATDLEWTAGDGPLVEGTAEAIIMAGAGRAVAASELSGEGAGILGPRIGA